MISGNVINYGDGLNLSTNGSISSLIPWGIDLLEKLAESGMFRNIERILGKSRVRYFILKTPHCSVF